MYIYIFLFSLILFLFSLISFYKKQIQNTKDYEKAIKILYRQSARWAAAAIQDDSTIIKVLHANYAAGYLWALKDIISTSEFKRITGQDFLEFENEIVKIQDSSTKAIVEKCSPLIFEENPILYKAMYLHS